MSIPILILGESGTGKSTALRNFEHGQCVVVNVLGKPLPFQGELDIVEVPFFEAREKKKRGIRPLKIDVVRAWMFNEEHAEKAVAVDDFGYCITDMFMRWTVGDEKFKDQFDVYKQIAGRVWNLLVDVMADGRPDRIAYFMMHTDTDNAGNIIPMTVGKLLNEKVNIRGICTCIFQSVVVGDEYKFVTNGGNPAKSPMGMFAEREIDNDLQFVDKTIREYYGYEPKGGAK